MDAIFFLSFKAKLAVMAWTEKITSRQLYDIKTLFWYYFFQFYSDYFYKAPQDAIVKTLVRNRVDTYMYVQNTTVEALKLPWWRQITHNLEHYFLSGAPFMDPVFFPEDQQVSKETKDSCIYRG